jgi:hypothetical protein
MQCSTRFSNARKKICRFIRTCNSFHIDVLSPKLFDKLLGKAMPKGSKSQGMNPMGWREFRLRSWISTGFTIFSPSLHRRSGSLKLSVRSLVWIGVSISTWTKPGSFCTANRYNFSLNWETMGFIQAWTQDWRWLSWAPGCNLCLQLKFQTRVSSAGSKIPWKAIQVLRVFLWLFQDWPDCSWKNQDISQHQEKGVW